MQLTLRSKVAAVGLTVAFLLQACTSAQRVDDATEFARAGVELSGTLPDLYDLYYTTAIKADSVTLEFERQEPNAMPAMLRSRLKEANTDMQQIGALIRGMKEHVTLLQEYFEAIQLLTDEEVGGGVGAATPDIVKGLTVVRSRLPARHSLGAPVGKAATPAGNFVVVALKNKALKEELETHGATIEAELGVREAVIRALGESMAQNQEAYSIMALENPMFESYESKRTKLPRRWIDNRIEFLTQPEKIETAKKAEEAMAALRKAWRELAGGGPAESTLVRLKNRVEATKTLIEKLQA